MAGLVAGGVEGFGRGFGGVKWALVGCHFGLGGCLGVV